ncbi:transmembrane efflux protein [Ameyamaea chiangmaiensis NBRC 103196]|uniref:MFS transporter n=1 Tax=Ameyamaea chiangmaiensis TaxID=442969 RepID=A0A850PAT0_9PROT|nr:MFS transporter [Ameyamaea chiangmaiensis]MBS4074018.1 MFS transporter [Ameyamaea chiangmaiensis]NVN39426.1 MFS transporter [Ameyamaea chiangmaiensis]GBQ67587.1 transmembrane efflux protein [Ameyamaea chiangmaiensis NBRC 103196]
MSARFPLFALAVGAFGIGTTEFAPMGLLPDIARDLHVPIPTAGMLITAYAVGVMVGAPLVTIGARRVPRHVLLISMMALFTLGNLAAAASSNYVMLMAARVLTSLAHGTFFGVGALVASSLVPPSKRSSAVSTMFMGLTIATIGGVPLATWLGDAIGWRTAFACIAVIGAVAMLAVWTALPKLAAESSAEVTQEVRVLLGFPVQMALLTTSLGAGAMFTLMTYIAPILQTLAHASPGFVTLMLALVGLGFTAGNYVGGKMADRSLTGTLVGFLALLSALMWLYPLVMGSPVATGVVTFLWGVAAFGIVPSLQTRVMTAAAGAPTLASSVNIGAFNFGNALGAVVGGGVLSAGAGYAAITPAGGLVSFASLLIVIVGRNALSARTAS